MPDMPFMPTGIPPFRGHHLAPEEKGALRHVTLRPALLAAYAVLAKQLNAKRSAVMEEALIYALKNLATEHDLQNHDQKAA